MPRFRRLYDGSTCVPTIPVSRFGTALAVLMLGTVTCTRPQPATDGAPTQITALPNRFALAGRVTGDAQRVEQLLKEQVIPSLKLRHEITDVATYVSAVGGGETAYVVTISLRGPGPFSPNLAFVALSTGRSPEQAKALSSEIRKHLPASPPTLLQHRPDLSISRSLYQASSR